MPLTTETLLAYSMGIIGTLLVLLISLVVYVFLTLREEVRGVSSDLSELNKHRVKLVHIDDEVGHTGIFLGGNLHIITLYSLRSSAGVNRIFLDIAQNGRTNVNGNAGLALRRLGVHGGFGGLFRRGLFYRHNLISSVCCTVGSFQ